MALEGFIPQLWAGTLLERLRKALVYASVANDDYEGEISSFGDTVKINQIGTITVSSYSPDVTSITPQNLDDGQKELKIDQIKYFAFEVDDVTAAQMKPKIMMSAMSDAAYSLRDTADQFIAAKWVDAAITAGLGTAAVPIDITSVNVVEYIGLVAQKMDENNVPTEGRWMIIPPWFHQKIVLAKITLDTSNSDTLTNGSVGRAMGFNFFVSNNVVNTANANSKVLAGYMGSMTFAAQVLKVEAYRPESAFSDAVKGLYVYGAKVVRPDTLALLTADYTAEP